MKLIITIIIIYSISFIKCSAKLSSDVSSDLPTTPNSETTLENATEAGTRIQNAGVKVILSKRALMFASDVALTILGDEMVNSVLPINLDKKISKMKVILNNIKITYFRRPKPYINIFPQREIIHVNLVGIEIRASGRMTVKGDGFPLSIFRKTINLRAMVKAENMRASFGIQADQSGLPKINKFSDCELNEVKFDIRTEQGNFINTAIRLAKGIIEGKLKKIISAFTCSTIRRVIRTELNYAINGLPQHVPIWDDFLLDYRLIEQGVKYHFDYVELELKGSISLQSQELLYPEPFNEIKIPKLNGTYPMVQIALSEQIANTLAYLAHESNILKFHVTPDNLPKIEGFEDLLNIFCEIDGCMGTLVAELKTYFPDCKTTMHIESNDAPKLVIIKKDETLKTELSGKFNVHSWCPVDENMTKYEETGHIFTIETWADVGVKPFVDNENNLLKANLTTEQCSVKVTNKSISMGSWIVEWLVPGLLKDFIDYSLSNITQRGIDLPVIQSVRLVQPKLHIDDGFLLIRTDLQFKDHYIPVPQVLYKEE